MVAIIINTVKSTMGIFTKKSDGESGGPNRHERRAAVARARHAPQWQREWSANSLAYTRRQQKQASIKARQERTRERKIMREKMAKVGEGIAQPHLTHKEPRATKS